jgi:hypothetical protein
VNTDIPQGGHCDTDHSLVVAKLQHTGTKKMSNTKIYVETESQEINNIESKEQYQAKISNRFRAVENLYDDVDITGAWETIRKNITFSQTECRLL